MVIYKKQVKWVKNEIKSTFLQRDGCSSGMFILWYFYGNILATENQQARINDVIEVKNGVYLHKA